MCLKDNIINLKKRNLIKKSGKKCVKVIENQTADFV